MFGAELFDSPFWWIWPLVMITLCYFMMRRRKGSMMCKFGQHDTESDLLNASDSAVDILDKRFAVGEINKEEYEEKKRTLNQSN